MDETNDLFLGGYWEVYYNILVVDGDRRHSLTPLGDESDLLEIDKVTVGEVEVNYV